MSQGWKPQQTFVEIDDPHLAAVLRALADASVAAEGLDWSPAECDAVVAAYFRMLDMLQRTEPFVKRRLMEELKQVQLPIRSVKSIEYKLRNISAVLQVKGMPWLPGFAPARNIQRLLSERVEFRLALEGGRGAVEEAEEALAEIAGRRVGQGFMPSAPIRKATEERAMKMAIAHYSRSYQVVDVHLTKSYDLECSRQGQRSLHVEVKGTSGDASQILLTAGEVAHLRSYSNTELFVLAGIEVEQQRQGKPVARGGISRIIAPWSLEAGTLLPLSYAWSLPEAHERIATQGPSFSSASI